MHVHESERGQQRMELPFFKMANHTSNKDIVYGSIIDLHSQLLYI